MKYLGSKRKLVKDILPIILENKEKYDYYIEPFCGSLAVIQEVEGIKKIASDINPFLIAMWECLKHFEYEDKELPKIDNFLDYLILVKGVLSFTNMKMKSKDEWEYFINKDVYDYYRKEYYEYKNEKYNNNFLTHYAIIGFVGFMASFNGRFYSGGYSGKTDKRNYIDEQIRNTLSQVSKLHDITFICNNYIDLFNRLCLKDGIKCIIYCDPPYFNTKQYEYSTKFNYNKFYAFCTYMAQRGHKVIISEYNLPSSQFDIIFEKEVTNSMNTTITKKPIEKLFIPNKDYKFENKLLLNTIKVDEPYANGRIYPKEVWEKAVNEYIKKTSNI